MTVKRGWFGKWKFSDRAHGWKGHISKKGLSLTKSAPNADVESYLPFSQLACELYGEGIDGPEVNEILTAHVARALHFQVKWKLRKMWSPLLSKAEKTITKGHLVWYFDEFGLKSIRRKRFGGFVLRMNSGRRIEVTQRGFNFDKSSNTPLPGEEEEYLGILRLESFEVAQAVWSGFSLPDLSGQALLNAAEIVESCGFTVKDDRVRFMRHFGIEAKWKRLVGGGGRVELPNGSSVHLAASAVQEVTGDGQLYAAALKYMHQARKGKPVVVTGSQENVLAGIAHGEQLGIEIIPELYPKRFYQGFALLGAIMCATAGFYLIDGWQGFLAGYGASLVLVPVLLAVLSRPMRRAARRRGNRLRNLFPHVQGGDRSAKIADAKARGMI